MTNNLTVEQLLAVLEEPKTPETEFATKLASANTTPVATTSTENLETDRLQKLAQEADEQGRIVARAFYDELQKIAVSPVGMTPNPAAIPDNPATQVSTGDIKEDDVAQVVKAIMQLTNGERMQGPSGTVNVNNAPVAPATPTVDEYPIAADVHKTAAVKVYEHYFGGK
jgi:NAD(P)-dependent dehydrogenase (short-subunit alcohol dehydrogenase family)